MAADPRVLGQQTQVAFILDGEVVSQTFAIKSNSLNFQMEILTEGYLGETTNRRDNVFNGMAGSVDLHFSNVRLFTFVQALVDAARRRVQGVNMNVKHTYQFMNNRRAIVVLPSVSVGEIPLNNGGRAEFVTGTIPYEAESSSLIVL